MALTKRLVVERGLGVLFTEHSMDVVFAYADRIIVLARGRLIAEGTPAEIRDHPKVQEVYFGSGKTFERMTTPRPPGTAIDPPGGSGLAWGGPALRSLARLNGNMHAFHLLLEGLATAEIHFLHLRVVANLDRLAFGVYHFRITASATSIEIRS